MKYLSYLFFFPLMFKLNTTSYFSYKFSQIFYIIEFYYKIFRSNFSINNSKNNFICLDKKEFYENKIYYFRFLILSDIKFIKCSFRLKLNIIRNYKCVFKFLVYIFYYTLIKNSWFAKRLSQNLKSYFCYLNWYSTLIAAHNIFISKAIVIKWTLTNVDHICANIYSEGQWLWLCW